MPGPNIRVYRHVRLIMRPHRPHILHGIFHIPPWQIKKIPKLLSDIELSKAFLVRLHVHINVQTLANSGHVCIQYQIFDSMEVSLGGTLMPTSKEFCYCIKHRFEQI